MYAIANVFAALLAITASATVSSGHASSRKTREIVHQVTRASGGLASAQAIAALEYRLHIQEPTYQADAIYLVDRHGRMRIDVSIGGKRVYTECLNGKHAWQMGADGVAKPESTVGTASLYRGTQSPGQILALAELPAHGHRISYVGRRKIDGVSYQVLRLTMSDGFQSYRFIDPHTRLIMRSRDSSALHPDIDPAKHPSERHGVTTGALMACYARSNRFTPICATAKPCKRSKSNRSASCRNFPRHCS